MSALPPIAVEESNDPLATPRRVALVRPDIRPAVRRREERMVTTFPHLIVREVILFQVVTILLSITALVFDAPLQGIANPTETPNPAKAPWYFLGLQELLHYFPPIVAGVLLPGLVVVALVVIPYARVNLSAGPLWAGNRARTLLAVTAGILFVTALSGAFGCWPVVVPTLAVGAAMLAAYGGERGGRLRRAFAPITLPEWIMTWFVIVATVLTVIGTFFRGPGWSFVWPWASFRTW
jgi:quinol---cytochrome c reductase cytochrome c subunit, bacillus type